MTEIEKAHEKVLIIGNGFDLNLGLKTCYSDFIKSEDFAKLFRPNSLFSYLKDKHDLNTWIDIEIGLKTYSQNFHDTNLEKDHKQLCEALMSYISKIDYTQINKSSEAFKLIKELSNKNLIIFDFNYSESLMHIGKTLGLDLPDWENRIIKVHGSAKEKSIIFGVEDKARISDRNVFLKKSFPIHYKAISLTFQLKNAVEIYFFGYSLGQTDHTYLTAFFPWASNEGIPQNNRTIFLYFYDEAAYKDLHIELDTLTNKNLMGLKHVNRFKPIPTQ